MGLRDGKIHVVEKTENDREECKRLNDVQSDNQRITVVRIAFEVVCISGGYHIPRELTLVIEYMTCAISYEVPGT